MGREVKFRQALMQAAAAVMRCDYCRSHAPRGDQPQPGWVGRQYTPGRSVVVVLQNPAGAPSDYGTAREKRVQQLLHEFAATPSIESHTRLMRFMLADMAGLNGGTPWRTWQHPVSKLITDREKLAWMNVVKFRTPGSAQKDDPVTEGAATHGATTHLQRELGILEPRAVVAIGNEARSALDLVRFPPTTIIEHLKLRGASTDQVLKVRTKLLKAGADI